MQAGQVDLVLNLKGQPQAVQGVSQFQQAITAMGGRTEAALAGVNKAATEATEVVSKMATAVGGASSQAGAGISQMAAALTASSSAVNAQVSQMTQAVQAAAAGVNQLTHSAQAANQVLQQSRAAAAAMATQAHQVDAAFSAVASETQGLEGRLSGLVSGWKAAGASSADMLNRLGPLKASLAAAGLPAGELDVHFQRLRESISAVPPAAAGFTESFKGMVAAQFTAMAAAQLVVSGIERAGRALIDFGEAAVQTALQYQKLDQMFRFTTGSVQAGAAELAFTRAESNKLGLSFVATAEGYARLSVAARGTALEGQKTRDIFKAVAEASTAMRLSSEQSGGALVALEQMISKGTVMSQELKLQLGNALPGAFELAAKAMGVTTKQFNQMLDTGQVVAEDFLPKFAAALHANFGQAAEEASGSAQSAFGRFGNAVKDVENTLGQGLMPILQSAAEKMAKFLEGQVDGIQKNKELRAEMVRINEVEGIYGPKVIAMAERNLILRKEALDLAQRMDEIEKHKTLASQKTPTETLTKEQVAQAALLQKELATAQAQATLEGAEMENAIEEAVYQEKLEKYKGVATLLELARKEHYAKLAAIARKAEVEEAAAETRARQTMIEIHQKNEKYERTQRDKEVDEDDKRDRERRAAKQMLALQDADFTGSQFEKQRAVLAQHYEKEAEDTVQAMRLIGKTKAETATRLTALEAQNAKEREKIDLDEMIARSQMAAELGSNLIQGMDAVFSASRKNAILHKALAIAQIEIDGALAAMKAFSAFAEFPPLAFAAAAAIEIKTQALAYRASQQKMAQGGIVQGDQPYGDRVPIWANSGEMVLNAAHQRTLFNMLNGPGAGSGNGGGNTIHVTYAPAYHGVGGSGSGAGQSFTDMARNDKVEFGRFLTQEVFKKGYA